VAEYTRLLSERNRLARELKQAEAELARNPNDQTRLEAASLQAALAAVDNKLLEIRSKRKEEKRMPTQRQAEAMRSYGLDPNNSQDVFDFLEAFDTLRGIEKLRPGGAEKAAQMVATGRAFTGVERVVVTSPIQALSLAHLRVEKPGAQLPEKPMNEMTPIELLALYHKRDREGG
jgi:hypothetical protein